MYDAAVLEFDFIPAGNVVEFKYVFASEEYLEYVHTNFNDAFGFFLSGPGISGPYTNNAVNLAALPNGEAVTINTIHPAGTNIDNQAYPAHNQEYYVNNPSGSLTMQYDGYTVVLTASYPVTPCETYRIKMAVADASDQKWDAGVFLGARSFNSETISLTNFGNNIEFNNNIFEGCNNNYFLVRRHTTDLSEPYTVSLILSGTAINGTDIMTTGGQPFPTQITIPAGQATYQIPYYVVSDGIADNAETFIIRVLNSCPCASTVVYVQQNLNIYELVSITSIAAQNSSCNGQSNGVITVNATGGSSTYEYSKNNGTSWQTSNTFTGLSAGDYTILVRDPGSCHDPVSGSATVGSPSPIVANAGPDVTICSGISAQLNGSGGVLYSWSPTTGLNNPNIANPIASPTSTTTYTLTVTNALGQCPSSDQVVVTVNPSPTITVNPVEIEVCAGTSTTITASGAQSYIWNPGGTASASITVSPATNTSYVVTGTGSNGCTGNATATVIVKYAPADVNAGNDASIGLCQTHQLQGSAMARPGEVLSFTWAPVTGLSNPNISNPVFTPITSGTFTYTLSVSGTNGCSSSDNVMITVAPAISVTASVINNSCQNIPDGSVNISVNGGTPPYSFNWTGPNGFTSSSEDISSLFAGTYQVLVTDSKGCTKTASFTVLTIADIIAPVPDVTFLPDISGECDASVTPPTATDNCAGIVTGTTSDPLSYASQGTYTITWIYTDGNGNTATQTQNVIVDDNTAPVVPVLADAAGECS
ncbi:MAG: hypothetical protein CVU14_11245, partial [Bacteroidetes bacterium HGW-Bacteroidetes-9]